MSGPEQDDQEPERPIARIDRVPVGPTLSYREMLTLALVMQPGKDYGLYGPWQCPQVMHDLGDAEFAYFSRLSKLLAPALLALPTEQIAALIAERVMLAVDPLHPRFLRYIRPQSR